MQGATLDWPVKGLARHARLHVPGADRKKYMTTEEYRQHLQAGSRGCDSDEEVDPSVAAEDGVDGSAGESAANGGGKATGGGLAKAGKKNGGRQRKSDDGGGEQNGRGKKHPAGSGSNQDDSDGEALATVLAKRRRKA